ncbi:MAG: SRPBCC family protein [Myxococcales bacterium]|nr:SRPBCC family protein [Myxococcales bacterium]
MRSSIARALAVLTLAFVAWAPMSRAEGECPVPDVAASLDVPGLLPLLEQGTVVLIHPKGPGEAQFLTGVVLVDAPPEKVWEVATDYAFYGGFVPNVHAVTPQREVGPGARVYRYELTFNVLWPLKFSTRYDLLQTFDAPRSICGVPDPAGKSDFTDVRFRTDLLPVGADRTAMVYTTFADLKSFSTLGRLVFNSFPEFQTPMLVAVATLYPEAIKSRIEHRALIDGLWNMKGPAPEIPTVLTPAVKPALRALLDGYRVVVSHYPVATGQRFVSAITRVPADADAVAAVVGDYDHYPEFVKFMSEAEKFDDHGDTWQVRYETEVDLIFKIGMESTLRYRRVGPREAVWALNPDEDHDPAADWGRVAVEPEDGKGALLAYTQFLDIGSGSFLIRALTGKIQGFQPGMRIVMADLWVR